MEHISILNAILYGVYLLLIIGTIVVILSENRNPIRTSAWLLVLIFIPLLGLLLYYFFGQDTRRMRSISRDYYNKIKKLSFHSLRKDDSVCLLPQHANLIKLLKRNNHSTLLQGSEIEIIVDGKRKIDAMLEDMDNAKDHIHIEYFIFKNDETGKKVKAMLMKKAAQGVEVRFIYDNVANWRVPARFYDEMKTAGVQIASLMKARFPKLKSKINYRNHRKVVVIDGEISYMGGMNIADEYAVNPTWRDTDLRIKGQGASGLQACFLIDWYASGEILLDNEKYFPPVKKYSDNLMQVATGGPFSEYHNLLQATLSIIMGAQKYIYLQTPYFLPTESLFQTLEVAALSGVDVRLMVSKKSDSRYIDPAAHSYYEDLLAAGMKIYEMQDKFVHAKTLVADDMISVIGSANLDFRSFETNFEINCYMYDPKIAQQNREIFFRDMKYCKEIHYDKWIQRPGWKKLLESVMRLFAPLF